jgi:GAF domain-containing protein/DNA-binding NarL/FixJ family response regulator
MFRVLILDDDDLFGRTLGDRLKLEREISFVVTSVTTAEAARSAVVQAEDPFDVFLIDQRLGPGADGIAVMEELRRLSPDSDAVILTVVDDPDTIRRAFDAGVYRYLPKPFDTPQLLLVLRSLYEQRRVQRERNWLRILAEVAAEAQRGLTVKEVGMALVSGGLKLGFERGHLWLLAEDNQEWVGLYQQGYDGLDNFDGLHIPVKDAKYPYDALIKGETVFFHGAELGPGPLQRVFGPKGFRSPVGEWVEFLLMAGNRCIATLALDNAMNPRDLRPEQRDQLRLFGNQAAAALERARLYEQEVRSRQELAILNEIGRQITSRAAQDDLDALLWEVRTQVGKLMDVRNFMVVLLDEETRQLDFRFHVKNGQIRERHWHEKSTGLLGYVITKGRPLFLPTGDRVFRQTRGIHSDGQLSKCWLGVPLRVGRKTVGAIAVHSHERENAYTKEDQRLLTSVADQVAGAIQTANLAAQKADSAKQLSVLHRASLELTALAMENEDWLWHAALTVATAGFGLGFNRAALLLAEQGGRRLSGRMGIGHFDSEEARRIGERDVEQKLDFNGYLQRLHSYPLEPTPVEHAVRELVLDLAQEESAFSRVVQEGNRLLVPAAEAAERLPAPFVKRFGVTDYAVMPVRAGEETLGLVVVDNIHDGKPLRKETLDRLETMLAQAALAGLNRHQREVRDKLLDANYAIMAEMGERPLKETLTKICQAAQAVTRANCVLIYSLKAGVEPYDYESMGSDGQYNNYDLGSKPRQQGVTAHILRAGTLVVPDIALHPHRYGSQELTEHPFLRREGIQAFVGTPVMDVETGQALGVLYLDYRHPRPFSELDIHLAGLFANLAAVAIRTWHVGQQVRANLDVARGQGEASERELAILRRVLEEALAADTNESRVARALLSNARELLRLPDTRVGLRLRGWHKPAAPEQEPCEESREYFLNPDGTVSMHIEPDISRGISGRVLRTGRSERIGNVHEGIWTELFYDPAGRTNTQSELNVPIKLGQQVIGAINVESPQIDAFSEAHQAALERQAAGAALALDNVRRQKHLLTVLHATQAVTAPTDLKATLHAIRDAAQSAAPGLSALATWYKDPEDEKIRLGSYFGVKDKHAIEREEPSEDGIVQWVMRAPVPIWAPAAQEDPRIIKRSFIMAENIVSMAAFPLRAGGEVVGAMFFNYRQRHEFSSEEKTLFLIFAEITAASVRQAIVLEQAQREKKRLAAAQAITEAVGTTLNRDEVLRKIMARLKGEFPAAVPCVLLYDEVEHALDFAPVSLEFYHINNPELHGKTHLKVDGPGIVCRVARQCLADGQPALISVPDVRNDPDYIPHIWDTGAGLYGGLMSGKRLLGVLALESLKAFDADDERLVHSVAQHISLAIDRANTADEQESESTMTGAIAWGSELVHDVRNTVHTLRLASNWLHQEEGLSGIGQGWVQEISEQADRMEDMLDIQDPTLRPFVLNDLLKQIGTLAQKRNWSLIQVQLDLHRPYIVVLGDPQMFWRCVQHLVYNAVEAMREQGKIWLCTRDIGNPKLVELQIRDTGPGVPEEFREKLFTRRVSSKGKGHGLGLPLTRIFMRRMGGSVHILPSSSERGAIFALRLPLATDDQIIGGFS